MCASLHDLRGVFYFDARVVTEADERLEYCGRDFDSVEAFRAPGLLIACGGYRHSAVPAGPGLALFGERDACAWDGRLDNRTELSAAAEDDRLKGATEASLALALYRRERDHSFRRLLGDWSLVLWDGAARALVLASDYAGVRPLYYSRTPQRVVWSSSLEWVVRRAAVDDIDEEYVTEFLTRGLVAERTPFRGILPVPPGCAVVIAADETRIHRFWHFPVARNTRHARESDYADELNGLFREAVRVRLDEPAVCAELSGGLDSSSVVCMANRLIAEGSVPANRLITFTYDEEGSPDQPFQEAVERACGSQRVHMDTTLSPPVAGGYFGKAMPMCWEARWSHIAGRLTGLRSNTLLTGQLGDLIMANWADDSEQSADLFREGRLWRATREAFAWSRWLQVPAWPVLWRAVAAAIGREPSDGNEEFADARVASATFGDSVTAAVRRRASVGERRRQPGLSEASPSRRKRLRALDELLQARKLECPSPLRQVSYTHPFLHRPLVEFMFTIPSAIACRPGESRRLMRRAFSGLLPAPVLRRRSKGNYGALFTRSFQPLAAGLARNVNGMRLVELGYVDPASVATRLERLSLGLPCNGLQLQNLILLEYWLRESDLWFHGRDASLEPAALLV